MIRLACCAASLKGGGDVPPENSVHELRAAVPALLDWYRSVRRPLPFRENATPYRVWVSEVMLQQTRIEAALPYFERFMQTLPTIADLAEVDEERLLKLWEGLGYYSRARHLRQAALAVVSQYGGELPADYDQLVALPGIGEYTAGAIASIAFGLPVPAVDGNVLRVMARLTLCREDVLKPAVRRAMREQITTLLPPEYPGLFNEAVMELGETVCLPHTQPHCELCPLSAVCRAHAAGCEAELPVRTPPKARRREDRVVFCVTTAEAQPRVWLRRRPKTGLLAGLWEFPHELQPMTAAKLAHRQGLRVLAEEPLPPARHIFSHLEWHMTGVHLTVEPFTPPTGTALVTADEQRERCALPGALAAYAAYLPEWLGGEA